jgi:OOP family OmpA-OmpF porin
MRLSVIATLTGTFATAAGTALVAAYFAVGAIETASERIVKAALVREGLDWAEVDSDGLQVFLHGTAPDEAQRFNALSVAGTEVDTTRLIDQMLVEETAPILAPRFSVEILRNDAGLSLIGLIPATTDREALMRRMTRATGGAEVSDFLEVADYPAPEGWEDALRFAVEALEDLPRSKISITGESVAIKAVAEDTPALRRLESALARSAPDGLALRLDLTAPRPVIAPFALRFEHADGVARLAPCAADSAETRDAILRAAAAAGLEGKADCRIGLGVPSSDWGAAAVLGLDAVAALGGGSLALTNMDMRLIAPEGTDPARYDRVVGDLTAALPVGIALTADLPPPPTLNSEPDIPEFVATLSPEGAVQLRGRLGDAVMRETATSLALASFGTRSVRMAARLDPNVPPDWAVRVFAALEALAQLSNGAVTVTPDRIIVSGRTGSVDTSATVAALLTDKLGADAGFDLDIAYVERLDPANAIPTAEECAAGITEIIGDRKITFEPASATLDASAEDILDELAELLRECGDMALEIGGHTDSQGREIMNQQLSQERAQAVLDGLRDRLVPVRDYTVVGYGETQPIADNDTEEGREINRRIEFRLILPEPAGEETSTLDALAGEAPADIAGAAPDEAGDDSVVPDGDADESVAAEANDADQETEGTGDE